MKKHLYNSLSEFYDDVKNHYNTDFYRYLEQRDDPGFTGLSLKQIKEYKFSYPVGVDKIRSLPDFEMQGKVKIKYWDQFDGFDIDIDRMYSDLDFLLNERKVSKLPKTMDVFINFVEPAHTDYTCMLMKAYTALKITDHLETLGVRTGLFACSVSKPRVTQGDDSPYFIEICVKQYSDPINLGALCTAISPWMSRYWEFLWAAGHYQYLSHGVGNAINFPPELKGIIIDTRQCHTLTAAKDFINSIQLKVA